MTKYNIPITHPIIRLLIFIEKVSIRFANHIITPNIAFRDLFIERGCRPQKIDILMNTPMEKILNNREAGIQNLILKTEKTLLMNLTDWQIW